MLIAAKCFGTLFRGIPVSYTHLDVYKRQGILQGLVVEQPVQLCPLCRGVAVFVLNGDAVDGKGGAILEDVYKRQPAPLF